MSELNALLSQATLWNRETLRVWLDQQPVPLDKYYSHTFTNRGYFAAPDGAQIEQWFRNGASIVLNDVDTLTAGLRNVADVLENEFLGLANANIYCSAGGRSAFASHYDDHEVFAFHIAGEKTWRVYQGRVDNPVGQPAPRPGLQGEHDRAKGDLLFEAVMRPGDLMYLPRGQYHDALASTQLSLHVTFSVIPANGLTLFELLEKTLVTDSLFRDDLPNPMTPEGREALTRRLGDYGDKISEALRSDAFLAKVIDYQRSRRRNRPEIRIGSN